MHRVVIGLTALLSLTASAVVVAYLLFFASSPDRAAAIAPADTLVYANVYLQPSAGQRMNFSSLATRFPGYGDPATLGDKIDETLQRFLGEAGIDYRADLKPWLGDQLAIALSEGGGGLEEPAVLVIADARDPAEAEAAVQRLAQDRGERLAEEEHAGTRIWVGQEATYALVDEMLLVGHEERVRAAIDAQRGASPALGDEGRFVSAIDELPPDHLATVYVDLVGIAALSDAAEEMAGYSVAGMAIVAESDGIHVIGHAPFDNGTAGEAARAAFALATEPSSLTGWMPPQTQISLVVFGVRQAVEASEQQLGDDGQLAEVAQALNQLRAILAFGLGLDLDADLLPLVDRETALGITDLASDPPAGVLLMRPSDAAAAEQSLGRIRQALEERGIATTDTEVEGVTVTTASVPDLADVSWAIHDQVVLLALEPEPIAAAVAAHRSGDSLAASDGYRAALDGSTQRAGNEIYVDARGLVDLLATTMTLGPEVRGMLEPIQAVGMTMPAREDRIEFHLVVAIDEGR